MYNKLCMSKIVLEIEQKQPLSQNDVIRYNKKTNKWEIVSYKSFNNELYKERNKLEKEIQDFKEEFANFKNGVNQKLKEHNDAIYVLTH